ncbi:MAG: GntR family transcriptional regulator [Planctomycetaceae bacterium]|nr:GntR family transcriptional regulator [Planctomycetaceae bacterium]
METSDFQPPSLTDVAYQELRKNILRGTLPPGHKLVVNELVDEWKISNTPIKEALNRLVAEELVEALPRRGMRVRKYNSKETREIFEIRTLYEVHCCRAAALAASTEPELTVRLGELVRECGDVMEGNTDDPMRIFDLDAQFHLLIVSQCGNETLIRDFDRLHAHTLAIGISVNNDQPFRRWEETQLEHEKIYQAIRLGSPDAAEAAMREHLRHTSADLLSFFHPQSGRLQRRPYNGGDTDDDSDKASS